MKIALIVVQGLVKKNCKKIKHLTQNPAIHLEMH